MVAMFNSRSQLASGNSRRFSIAQMLMLVTWLALLFALFRSLGSETPRTNGGYSKIAVSESGEIVAAVHWQGIHLFRNDKYFDQLYVGRQVDSLKFIDDETLAIVCVDDGFGLLKNDLPPGVHFYSLNKGKFTRWLPLKPKLNKHVRVRLLDDKFIVQQIDKNLVGQFHVYDMDASQNSKPLASFPSRHTNMPFAATNNARHIVFYSTAVLSNNFQSWNDSGFTSEHDLEKGESTNLLGMSNGVAFSRDASFVITCADEITKFNWPFAERQWSIPCDEPVGRIRISQNGERFAVLTGTEYAKQGRYLRVFDSHSSEQLLEVELNESFGLGFTLSADGQSVWTAPLGEPGGLLQWDIASNSVAKRIGSRQIFRKLVFFFTLFFLWAVLYGKSFMKPAVMPGKSRGALVFTAGLLGLIGIVSLALGCYFAFTARSPSYVSTILAVTQLVNGSLFVAGSIRLFFAAPGKEDGAAASEVTDTQDVT